MWKIRPSEVAAVAALTRLDVDDLEPVADVLRATLDAVTDADLDGAAVALAVLLSVLPSNHVLVVAARAGLDIGDDRRANRRAMIDVSHAVAAAYLESVTGRRRRRHAPIVAQPPAIPYAADYADLDRWLDAADVIA